MRNPERTAHLGLHRARHGALVKSEGAKDHPQLYEAIKRPVDTASYAALCVRLRACVPVKESV